MRTHIHKTAQFGELVAAIFDEASCYSTNPKEVSRMAAQAIAHMLRRGRRTSILPAPLATCAQAAY